MSSITFRDLKADEIECRVAQITEKGLSLLLYKDARCDQKILDETVGVMNWQNQYSRDNANCVVSIWDEEKKQWISKENTGKESNTEAEKGLASDSFKRACFNWGIGRELYTAPFIWVTADCCNIEANSKGKKICKDKFSVSHIRIEDKRITELKIFNQNTNHEVFTYGIGNSGYQQKPHNPPAPVPPESQIEYVLEPDVKRLVKMLREKGITQKSVCEQFGISSLLKLTMEQYEIVCNSIAG